MSTGNGFKKLRRTVDFIFLFFKKLQEDLSSLRTLGTGEEGDTFFSFLEQLH